MTQRLILGRHPADGSYGIWLSRPGIDATTTVDPNNFLICPGVKNEMVLMAGTAVGGQVIFFPYTLSIKPFVYFNNSSNGGQDWYPFDIQVVTKAGECGINVTTTYMQFIDGTNLNLTFIYMVTSRALP